MKYFFVLLTLFLSTFTAIFAQTPAQIIRSNLYMTSTRDAYEPIFVDNDGKVVFTLPPNHNVIRDGSLMNVFREGIAVVQIGKGEIYWMNEKGKKIKEFGTRYKRMKPMKNGYVRAWKKIEGKKGDWIVFLNRNGEELFEGKVFRKANDFSEGLAAVQYEKDGLRSFIDENGETVLSLNDYDPKLIRELYDFHNGIAKVKIKEDIPDKYITSYFFINKKGEKVIDLKELYPNRRIHHIGNFSNEWLNVAFSRERSNFNDVVFLDKEGNEKLRLESVETYGNFWKDGVNYYTEGEHKEHGSYTVTPYWIDKEGNREEAKLNDAEKILYKIGMKNATNYYQFQIAYDNYNHCWGLYKTNPLKEFFFTKGELLGYDDTRVFTRSRETNIFTLTRIEDGKILWQSPIEEIFFNSTAEALKYKKQVTRFNMDYSSKFDEDFYELKNLQFLSLHAVKIKELPKGILNFKKLKKLEVKHMDDLQYFPEWLSKLKKLEYLEVRDCDNYKGGLEYVIKNLPALKKVKLVNLRLESGFIDEMKKRKPNLVIDAEIWEDAEIDIMDW